jgi:hypothetical protein
MLDPAAYAGTSAMNIAALGLSASCRVVTAKILGAYTKLQPKSRLSLPLSRLTGVGIDAGMATKATRYTNWRRFVLQSWSPELPEDIDLAVLKVVALNIAEHGRDFGMHCCPGNVLIGKEIGRNRNTIKRYRDFLVEQGLFVETGAHAGRVKVLDIAIPGEVIEDETPIPVAQVSHDPRVCRHCGSSNVVTVSDSRRQCHACCQFQ